MTVSDLCDIPTLVRITKEAIANRSHHNLMDNGSTANHLAYYIIDGETYSMRAIVKSVGRINDITLKIHPHNTIDETDHFFFVTYSLHFIVKLSGHYLPADKDYDILESISNDLIIMNSQVEELRHHLAILALGGAWIKYEG